MQRLSPIVLCSAVEGHLMQKEYEQYLYKEEESEAFKRQEIFQELLNKLYKGNSFVNNRMEKVLIAINSFKRSISFTKGNEAISLGIKDIYPEGEIVTLSLADGGEGTIYDRHPYR
jgi:hypothetical protein